jgi:outer membrane lipoprotein-sorting protein
MLKTIAALVVLGLALPAWAQKKPCEELKAEIEAKLKSKGVEKYTLDIVPADAAKDAKIVGSCDGGAKRIVYKRG